MQVHQLALDMEQLRDATKGADKELASCKVALAVAENQAAPILIVKSEPECDCAGSADDN